MTDPRPANWWLPAGVVASVGVVATVVGNRIGDPEAVDGVVIGVLAFVFAGVMFVRRASE